MSKTIAERVFSDGEIGLDDLTDNSYIECHFINCAFVGGQANVKFTNCRFIGCEFDFSELTSCTFSNCDLLDYDFTEVNFDHSSFLDCQFGSSTFDECSLYGVRFDRCDIGAVRFVSCDAQFSVFIGADYGGIEFADTDLADADLSALRGLTRDQLRSAFGNARTLLPPGLGRPDHWFEENIEEPEVEGIPAQQPAPLRVVWRDRKLVTDPRGGVQEQFSDAALLSLYRALSHDISAFATDPPTNHPIVDRIKLIHLILARGPTSFNPSELGYHLEVLRAQVDASIDEITPQALSSIRGLITGGFLFVTQFEDWRSLTIRADSVEGRGSIPELSHAIRSLAKATEKSSALFERRIGESLSVQAEDVTRVPKNATVKEAAINSSGNVLSALAGRAWRGGASTAKTATDEAVKQSVKIFFDDNKESISELIEQAPRTMGWLAQLWNSLT